MDSFAKIVPRSSGMRQLLRSEPVQRVCLSRVDDLARQVMPKDGKIVHSDVIPGKNRAHAMAFISTKQYLSKTQKGRRR